MQTCLKKRKKDTEKDQLAVLLTYPPDPGASPEVYRKALAQSNNAIRVIEKTYTYATDPFNISNRESFIEFISPERTKGRTKKIKPPYSIFWESLTTDVGPVEHKSRLIDVRHVNGYLIIPGIVYLLSTKLQKAVLNDRLGEEIEMNLINYITR